MYFKYSTMLPIPNYLHRATPLISYVVLLVLAGRGMMMKLPHLQEKAYFPLQVPEGHGRRKTGREWLHLPTFVDRLLPTKKCTYYYSRYRKSWKWQWGNSFQFSYSARAFVENQTFMMWCNIMLYRSTIVRNESTI